MIWIPIPSREIKEHGYPFQCKVGNPLFSEAQLPLRSRGYLRDGVPSRKFPAAQLEVRGWASRLLSRKFGSATSCNY
jgi:hypothetical protein